MNRRTAGVLILALALVCTMLAARAGGVRVAGTAIAPADLSAPAVGDCVRKLSLPLEPNGLSVSTVGERAVVFGDCDGLHLGEVVAYRRMPVQASPGEARDGDIRWCDTVASDYQAHALWRVRSAAAGLWLPSTGQRFVAVLSAPNVDSAEPRWAACVLSSPGLEAYQGSYVRSLADGPAPPPFGVCGSGGSPERRVSCIDPHGSQEFGAGTGRPMTARRAVTTCRTLVGAMTGLVDPDASGVLRVEVIGGSASAVVDRSVRPASCRLSVVGHTRLGGTLVGIADGLLPLYR